MSLIPKLSTLIIQKQNTYRNFNTQVEVQYWVYFFNLRKKKRNIPDQPDTKEVFLITEQRSHTSLLTINEKRQEREFTTLRAGFLFDLISQYFNADLIHRLHSKMVHSGLEVARELYNRQNTRNYKFLYIFLFLYV